jgi:hypothetical protein
MLLGASSAAIDESADLRAVMGEADAGTPHGDVLADFAEAAWRRDDTLGAAREAVRDALGEAGLVEAAATVAIFRSLNIAADTSGIPLDADFAGPGLEAAAELGFNRFPTAANTPGAAR